MVEIYLVNETKEEYVFVDEGYGVDVGWVFRYCWEPTDKILVWNMNECGLTLKDGREEYYGRVERTPDAIYKYDNKGRIYETKHIKQELLVKHEQNILFDRFFELAIAINKDNQDESLSKVISKEHSKFFWEWLIDNINIWGILKDHEYYSMYRIEDVCKLTESDIESLTPVEIVEEITRVFDPRCYEYIYYIEGETSPRVNRNYVWKKLNKDYVSLNMDDKNEYNDNNRWIWANEIKCNTIEDLLRLWILDSCMDTHGKEVLERIKSTQ